MNKKLTPVIFCAVLLLQSCATSGIEASGTLKTSNEYTKHLIIHNESLANKIIIQQMNMRKSTDLLEVSTVLANLTNTDKKIQYRFSWYDADNFEVDKDSRGWTPATLSGKSSITMQAVAPNPAVTSYKINVKELK